MIVILIALGLVAFALGFFLFDVLVYKRFPTDHAHSRSNLSFTAGFAGGIIAEVLYLQFAVPALVNAFSPT